MSRYSRRHTSNRSKATASEPLSTAAAVDALSKFDKAKFDETVEVAIRLGIDPKQTAQAVRGAFSLPHGTGKQLKVVAFAEGADAEAALAAGAIEASGEELTKKIEGGWLDFDVAIAHRHFGRHVARSAGQEPRFRQGLRRRIVDRLDRGVPHQPEVEHLEKVRLEGELAQDEVGGLEVSV